MPVIAVINRKGGSGKSTLATHIAAWLAHQGAAVMLGDVDKQQSARSWLKLRDPNLPPIVAWAMDNKNILKAPAGVTHVVLDTPGGLHGFELARLVMSVDAVIMPVCNSLFDRESAAACHAELLTLPRVASGRCKLAATGMRLDARTKAAETLSAWAAGIDLAFLGVLREAQTYVKSLDTGETLFDLKGHAHTHDMLQWEPILQWLRPIAKPPTYTEATPPEPPTRNNHVSKFLPIRRPAPKDLDTLIPTVVNTNTLAIDELYGAGNKHTLIAANSPLRH